MRKFRALNARIGLKLSYEVYQKAQNLTADFQFDRAINLRGQIYPRRKFKSLNLNFALAARPAYSSLKIRL